MDTARSGSAEWKQSSILVVDDLEANVELLRRLLNAAGISNVTGLTDPREVLNTFDECKPDLILLDLHMPHLNGLEVMRVLGERIADDDFVPIAVLTADVAQESRERALAAGAKDFLSKPFNAAEVVLRVANLLEARRLYLGLRTHNSALAAQLRVRDERERRRLDEFHRQVERVRTVLAPGAISTVFQPIVDLRTGDNVGAEALTRFAVEPVRSPDVWFTEATNVGLGNELELEAVDVAIQQIELLPDDLFVTLNMSADAALDPRMHSLLCGLDGERVVVEITEHNRVVDYAELNEALDRFRSCGVRIAVDDTGAGFAGLQQIVHIRPEIIKLDFAITHDIDRDPVRRALAASLLVFASEIGALIVAEGIETEGELDVLRELGVVLGQGYHLGRPGPIAQLHEPRQLSSSMPRLS